MSLSNTDFGFVDEDALREAKRIPTSDLVSKLFPGHPVKSRGVFRSPFHEDRNPSFSTFPGHGGDWLWKDYSTDESGDNLALYRKVFPELSFQEAVDGLCRLVLGRTGLKEGVSMPRGGQRRAAVRRTEPSAAKPVENAQAQKVVFACSLDDRRVPDEFRSYWRGRGISDDVILRYCEYVCFENANQKGRTIVDPESGLPILDMDGKAVVDDGIRYGIGLKNDIGGYAIRVPDTGASKGYKTTTSSFVATFLSDGSRPRRCVGIYGEGDGYVHYVRYDHANGRVWINPQQFFSGFSYESLRFAVPFLESLVGERLYEREARGTCSVLDSLCSSVSTRGVAVEGMFDGLSQRELVRMRSSQAAGGDLVVLNSIGNIRWAAPFLARHEQVLLMLDNDLNSEAGQKAYVKLSDEIGHYNGLYGNRSAIFNGSAIYAGYKDLNDALKASKGFPQARQQNGVKNDGSPSIS